LGTTALIKFYIVNKHQTAVNWFFSHSLHNDGFCFQKYVPEVVFMYAIFLY